MNAGKYQTAILMVALLVASVLVVMLARQKQDLVARLERLTARLRDPHAGFYVPGVALESVDGDSVVLGQAAPGHTQVLFVLSTECDYCRASLPAWKSIASRTAHDATIEVYGLSLEGAAATRAYVTKHRIEFPVVSFTNQKLRALYRSNVFPQTLILDAEGRIEFARFGEVTSAARDSILGLLDRRSSAPTQGLIVRGLGNRPRGVQLLKEVAVTDRLKRLRNVAFAAGVSLALTFGATQALARPPCTELPPHTCDPGVNCWQFCEDNEYAGGSCYTPAHCCVCVEK